MQINDETFLLSTGGIKQNVSKEYYININNNNNKKKKKNNNYENNELPMIRRSSYYDFLKFRENTEGRGSTIYVPVDPRFSVEQTIGCDNRL